MKSMRKRALIGGIVSIVVTLICGGVVLYWYIGSFALQRFDKRLAERSSQLIVALSDSQSDPQSIGRYLTDPSYGRTYSGIYWQIARAGDGKVITSPSLFDHLLTVSSSQGDRPRFWVEEGPKGDVRGISQEVSIENGAVWDVTVAESIASLDEERKNIRQGFFVIFGVIATICAGAVTATIIATVQPILKLRNEVSHRWESGDTLPTSKYPTEVAPLVADINTLLVRNREIVKRARAQAADLAHALKTPSTILRNELLAIADKGACIEDANQALDRIDAQIRRSLARIRAGNSNSLNPPKTNVDLTLQQLVRMFGTIPNYSQKNLTYNGSGENWASVDEQDLVELVGNVLDNALQWSENSVVVSSSMQGTELVILVEDDGPGISPDDYDEVLHFGGRLDTSKLGSGLGLSISKDLLQSYGGTLLLGEALRLGGLKVTISIPITRTLGRTNI